MLASSLRPVPPRQGPRPLALHLANATGAWMSSRAALPLLRSGLLPWRPEFALQGGSLSLALAAAAKSDSFDAALDARADAARRRSSSTASSAIASTPIAATSPSRRCSGRTARRGCSITAARRSAGAGRAVADQSRLYPRSRAGAEPAALSRRSGPPAAAGRLGRAGRGRARLRCRRLHRAAAGAGGRGRAPSQWRGAGRCSAIAWADSWRWRSPRAGRSSLRALALLATPWRFHAERAEQARLAGRACRADREKPCRARRSAGRCAAGALRGARPAARAAQILALCRDDAGQRRGARLRRARGLAQ